MITLTLTPAETAAIATEQMPNESVESVIHRLIAPLVNRLAVDSFKAFVESYQNLPLESKVDLVATIQNLPQLRIQPVEDFDVVVDEVPRVK